MPELKGITSVLYAASEWIMRLAAVNLMWFILCLPFFLLLVTMDMSTRAGIVFFGVLAWLFGSFLIFPATAAVFSVVRGWLVESDYSSVTREYWIHLKKDYASNTKNGAAFAAIWLIWYYGYFYFYTQTSSLAFLFLIIGSALFVWTMNFFSISAHYEMSAGQRGKNAFFVSAGRPLLGLYIAGVSAVLLWISLSQLLVLIPLLTCSLIAFFSFSAFYRTVQKIHVKTAYQAERSP